MAKRRTPKKRALGPKTVEVKVDRALARRWAAKLAELSAANRHGAEEWDRKYEAVGAILQHDPPLYLAGGVASDRAFFAKYLPGEEPRTIRRNVRIAQYASPDEEARYGTAAIDDAISYLEATHGKPRNGRIPVDFAKLRIETAEGTAAFAGMAPQAVRAAARAATRASRHAKPARRNPVAAALAKRVPKRAAGVTIHCSGEHVTIGRIPIAQLVTVLLALAHVRLPGA